MSENDKPALMQAVYRLTRLIQILPLVLFLSHPVCRSEETVQNGTRVIWLASPDTRQSFALFNLTESFLFFWLKRIALLAIHLLTLLLVLIIKATLHFSRLI